MRNLTMESKILILRIFFLKFKFDFNFLKVRWTGKTHLLLGRLIKTWKEPKRKLREKEGNYYHYLLHLQFFRILELVIDSQRMYDKFTEVTVVLIWHCYVGLLSGSGRDNVVETSRENHLDAPNSSINSISFCLTKSMCVKNFIQTHVVHWIFSRLNLFIFIGIIEKIDCWVAPRVAAPFSSSRVFEWFVFWVILSLLISVLSWC